jgi:hypothetical protein
VTSKTGNTFQPGDCNVVSKLTGQTLSRDEINQLGDPIARLVLLQGGGFGCPDTFSGIQEKLRTTDAAKCVGKGVTSRFVSDRAQLLKNIDPAPKYRGVVTRECGARTDHELFISLFGVSAKTPSVPADVELIGEDKTRGVFNYYTREGGQWTFHTSSEEIVKNGYTCTSGACVPNNSAQARCGSCHVGGGLVMKELHSPWVNWEGDTTTPGLDVLFKTFPTVLGDRNNGVDLETKVTAGNRDDWTPHRIAILKKLGTQEVLRPLFCTLDMNLQSAGSNGVPDQIDSNFFVDPLWRDFSSVPIDQKAYGAKIGSHGQKVIDSVSGATLGTDTFFGFTYPIPGQQTLDYVQELLREGIVDDDFVKDVLAIDFTRPVYSTARCDLLQFAPQLSENDLSDKTKSAGAIRDGFIANLQGASGKGADLLKNLSTQGDAAAHFAAVDGFLQACANRQDKDKLIEDVLGVAAHLVATVRTIKGANGQGIIEFQETLPSNDIADSATALDPGTCLRTLQ